MAVKFDLNKPITLKENNEKPTVHFDRKKMMQKMKDDSKDRIHYVSLNIMKAKDNKK